MLCEKTRSHVILPTTLIWRERTRVKKAGKSKE